MSSRLPSLSAVFDSNLVGFISYLNSVFSFTNVSADFDSNVA